MFGLGFCIDYARAEMLQSRINAVADAAALTGTDIDYIQQTAAVTQAACLQVFNAQITDYADLTSPQVVCTVTNQGGLNLGRTVTVGWTGQSTNMFSGILGLSSLAISGTSSAYATQAPYMNFYLVMDKSPSMLLPTTSTGITEVQGATSDSCAFACHEQTPGAGYITDSSGNSILLDSSYYTSGATNAGVYYLINGTSLMTSAKVSMGTITKTSSSGAVYTITYKAKSSSSSTSTVSGYYADGYWLTHNYTSVYPSGSSIDLRVSDETSAAQQLIPYAQSQATANSVTYQLQFFSYDWTHPSASSPVTQYNSMTNVASLSTSSVPNLDTTQDWWYGNNCYTSSCSSPGDAATATATMLTSLNSVMATPGTGTSASSPQEVMLLITDGVTDELISGSRVNREFNSTDLANCTTIKNRGIKIAILYTYYDPAVIQNDSWSKTNVYPYLGNVLTALQSCASTANDGSPLVYTVQSNQSIATALQTLFQLTIANSHLIG
jgi:hypothetical protein